MSADSLETHDFAVLAKRISAWTTNSLLTLIVLVAGLGFGRQVLNWWAADAAPSSAVAASTGDPSQLQTLQFGDNTLSLGRRSIRGDKNKAVEQLRAQCREVLEKSPSAKTPTGEDKFLAFLADSTPVEQEPGKWQLYELNEAFPMAVGLARTTASASPPEKPNLAKYRVVVWGLAVPTGDKQWTLSTFQSDVPLSGSHAALNNIPLPPGSKRTLSLSASGFGIIAFGGSGQVAEWKQFYSDWFTDQRWRPVANWQAIDLAWHTKFAASGDSVDIRFGPDGRGGLSGLLMITRHEMR